MAEILSIPVEFDTIQVLQTHLESGSGVPHVVKRDVPRPPLGWFTHHAVHTFAKQCSEGRIGLNWQDNVGCARETWKSLSPEELFTLRQAADEDKQRYNERVELAGRGGAEELVHLIEQKKLQESGFAPSAFDLFKNSPQVRARLLNARTMKGEESLTLDIDPQPPKKSPSTGKRKQLGPKTRPPDYDEEGDEVVISTDDDKQKSQVADAKVDPDCWRPTGDDNLTGDEKKLLESIPPNVRRWDRSPRAARNAYTLYYADRLTAEGSPHLGEDPHCPSTRAKIYAAWGAADHDTRQRFENVAKIDKQEFDRQKKEWYNEWHKAWPDSEHRLLLRKVIDRWHPHSSFEDGQNRPRAASPPRGRQPAVPAVDYKLPCLYYPVIRTDYSNGAVYEHLRHVLLNSSFLGLALRMELTFYDGLQPPSTPVEDVRSYSEDDPRANDYEWCKTNLEKKSLDDLKASFGELSFHRKEHMPVYRFGGKTYAIIIDSQSMKDGTVVFVSLHSNGPVDTRPDDDRGPDGAWEQDPKKEWYLAPRVQAADVMIQLVNLDICNVNWEDFMKHEVDHGLDLLSDPKAQRWRGWQWAIEDVFGERALEIVVGVVETAPNDGFLPYEDEE